MEHISDYIGFPSGDTTVLSWGGNDIKEATINGFYGLLFLKGDGKARHGGLLAKWRQSYGNNQRDMYPDNLYGMTGAMRKIPPVKKKAATSRKKKKEEAPKEYVFAQKVSEEDTKKKLE